MSAPVIHSGGLSRLLKLALSVLQDLVKGHAVPLPVFQEVEVTYADQYTAFKIPSGQREQATFLTGIVLFVFSSISLISCMLLSSSVNLMHFCVFIPTMFVGVFLLAQGTFKATLGHHLRIFRDRLELDQITKNGKYQHVIPRNQIVSINQAIEYSNNLADAVTYIEIRSNKYDYGFGGALSTREQDNLIRVLKDILQLK